MARLSADEDGGSLQEGRRPILIISNDLANKHSPVVTSIVLAEQIMSLNKSRLGKRMGSIKETVYESQVDHAIKIQLNVQ